MTDRRLFHEFPDNRDVAVVAGAVAVYTETCDRPSRYSYEGAIRLATKILIAAEMLRAEIAKAPNGEPTITREGGGA